MFLIRLVFSPLRIALLVIRILGYSRFAFFVVGVAVGLLCAPTTGAQMREKLSDKLQQLTAGGSPGAA